MKSVVVNINTDSYDVLIGRPSKWGNPYEIGKDGGRIAVVKQYETYIRNTPLCSLICMSCGENDSAATVCRNCATDTSC